LTVVGGRNSGSFEVHQIIEADAGLAISSTRLIALPLIGSDQDVDSAPSTGRYASGLEPDGHHGAAHCAGSR
jgi:hypothetical protein